MSGRKLLFKPTRVFMWIGNRQGQQLFYVSERSIQMDDNVLKGSLMGDPNEK
jgi:hypothetical protein